MNYLNILPGCLHVVRIKEVVTFSHRATENKTKPAVSGRQLAVGRKLLAEEQD
jgi:hypothetical protein